MSSDEWTESAGSDRHYSESPFLRSLGTELAEWREGFVRIRLAVQPHHLNRSGVVNGGLLATLLDHAAGLSGLYCTVPDNRRYGMTLSLTSNYLAQDRTGILVATGTLTRKGQTVFFAKAEVSTEADLVLAAATGVYRYRTGSEHPHGVPRRANGAEDAS